MIAIRFEIDRNKLPHYHNTKCESEQSVKFVNVNAFGPNSLDVKPTQNKEKRNKTKLVQWDNDAASMSKLSVFPWF